MTRSNTQSGSSFFIILIGIAIFAGLSFAVLQGGRLSQSSLTGDQARIAAQDIIQYANTLEKAVQAMRLRGCSTTEISFEGMGLVNATAPSDESCHIFSLSGGKVNPKPLDATYLTGTGSSTQWFFSGDDDFEGIGTNGCGDNSCGELVATITGLKSDICQTIEKILGNTGAIPEDSNIKKTTAFVGTYDGTPNDVGDEAGGEALNKRGSACLYDTGESAFVFYQVLIAR